ncbi:DUF4325 domain-containing protein [Candidatus Peregrinibacteria bacterium]|nr:DUF4325 domain-containing protein [Candidatus Peregrinibacteria bacterium]
MLIIQLKKFGTTLTSRPAGKEAFAAFQPILRNINLDTRIRIDFDEVLVLGPSWADEFLTPILEKYKDRVTLDNTENPSVQATLELLQDIKKKQE